MENKKTIQIKNIKDETWNDFNKLKVLLNIKYQPELLEYLINKELKEIKENQKKEFLKELNR